jgi:hypothetical protein
MGKVRPATSSAVKAAEKPVAKAKGKPRIAFPKKNQPPTVAQFAALLPLPVGKRFEGVRTFLGKQRDVTEDVYFYGPKSGWGLRYLAGGRPVCSLFVHGDRHAARRTGARRCCGWTWPSTVRGPRISKSWSGRKSKRCAILPPDSRSKPAARLRANVGVLFARSHGRKPAPRRFPIHTRSPWLHSEL